VTVAYLQDDQEAGEYMGDIINAINKGGWLVTGTQTVATANYGVCIQVEELGQPHNPDPRHPTPDQQLTEAFQGIANCGGTANNRAKYSLTVVVGHRPLALDP
jgi:hypothetical protein